MSNAFNFKGKVIAITGGASGIGLATAELLASYGASVSIADLEEEQLRSVKTKIEAAGGSVMTSVVNVGDSSQVNGWIQATVQKFGKLDGAANLAGVTGRHININRVEELDDADWDFVINVNLTGTMYCTRAQIANMKHKGSIVNTASVAGVAGFGKNAAYTAAKHGVIGLSRSAAKETGDRGIRINCIAPGLIDTPMQRKASETAVEKREFPQAIKRMGEASEVAELIAWLLSDGSQYISGTVQGIDGAWMC